MSQSDRPSDVEYTLRINEKDYLVTTNPFKPLRDVLRYDIGLTGTKESCDTGVCGVCTVFIDGTSTKSCLVPVCKVADKEIVTVEGIADGDTLSVVQQSFVDCFASQCGYCIPGFIISAHALLAENPDPTVPEIQAGLSGNICRCTGYVKIIDAVKDAAKQGASTD